MIYIILLLTDFFDDFAVIIYWNSIQIKIARSTSAIQRQKRDEIFLLNRMTMRLFWRFVRVGAQPSAVRRQKLHAAYYGSIHKRLLHRFNETRVSARISRDRIARFSANITTGEYASSDKDRCPRRDTYNDLGSWCNSERYLKEFHFLASCTTIEKTGFPRAAQTV